MLYLFPVQIYYVGFLLNQFCQGKASEIQSQEVAVFLNQELSLLLKWFSMKALEKSTFTISYSEIVISYINFPRFLMFWMIGWVLQKTSKGGWFPVVDKPVFNYHPAAFPEQQVIDILEGRMNRSDIEIKVFWNQDQGWILCIPGSNDSDMQGATLTFN